MNKVILRSKVIQMKMTQKFKFNAWEILQDEIILKKLIIYPIFIHI